MPDSDTRVPKLAGYELLATLGKGGMGVVFKARQVSMDRIVALKVLAPRLAKNAVYVQRFLREARSAAKLNHPNIVQGIDVGEAGGHYYFAMEFVDGTTVKEMIKGQGRLDEKTALSIVGAVARALEHAAKHGIIHRDIKPDNIMVARDGVVKLADLGIARASEKPDTLTTEGVAVGTPHYMAPEQVRGDAELDSRTDIYALGATLYHMVTGDFPFTGPNASAIMAKHMAEPAPVAKEKHPDVSRATSDLIERMMAKDPADRPQTPTELLQEIKDALAGKVHLRAKPAGSRQSAASSRQQAGSSRRPVGGVGPLREARPSSKVIWVALAAVAAIAIIFALVALLRGSKPPDQAKNAKASTSSPVQPSTPSAKVPEHRTPGTEQPSLASDLAALRSAAADLAGKEQFAEALRQADVLALKHPGAAAEIDKVRQGIAVLAERRYHALSRAADAAIEAKDFAKAREALKPAEAFGIAEFAERAKKRLAEIASREKGAAAWAKWDEAKASAAKLTADGKFDDAAKLLDAARTLPLDDIAGLVAEQMKSVESGRRKAAEAALAAYQAESEKLWALFKERNYAEAEKTLTNLPQAPNLREAVATDAEAGRLLKEFWAAVERGVLGRKGKFVSIAGKGGNVESVENGQVTLKVGAKQFTQPLLGMDAAQAAAIADLKDDERGNLAKAVFLLAESQELEAAEKALAAAGNPPGLSAYKARLASLLAKVGKTPAGTHTGEPGLDPKKALAAAEKSIEAGDYAAARRALDAVLKAKPDDAQARQLLAQAFARVVQQAYDVCKDVDLEAARKAIAAAAALQPEHPDVAALANWFKAASHPLFADTFDRAASLASWNTRSGTWKVDHGELTCEYDQEAMAFLKRAPFQDFVFECDVKCVGEKPGLVVGIVFRYTARRWLFALLYDAFDQAEGGGATGRGWYLRSGPGATDTPRAKDVTYRHARLNIQAGDTYHLKLKCNGRDVECFINGKLELQLTDEKPTAGELAFLSAGQAARFDNVRLYRVVPLPELKTIKPPGPAPQEAEPSNR
ncbi:MAG: DUF1080 domain-containing protein [Planctomycetes bacterium]|nr:DUF1080 domain-containing protein [Planctomycetota bacterium]